MLKYLLLQAVVVVVIHMATQALVVAVAAKLRLAQQHLAQHLK
jgi:hypothetical protein